MGYLLSAKAAFDKSQRGRERRKALQQARQSHGQRCSHAAAADGSARRERARQPRSAARAPHLDQIQSQEHRLLNQHYRQPGRDRHCHGRNGDAARASEGCRPARCSAAFGHEPHFEGRMFAAGRNRVQIKSVRRSNPLYTWDDY